MKKCAMLDQIRAAEAAIYVYNRTPQKSVDFQTLLQKFAPEANCHLQKIEDPVAQHLLEFQTLKRNFQKERLNPFQSGILLQDTFCSTLVQGSFQSLDMWYLMKKQSMKIIFKIMIRKTNQKNQKTKKKQTKEIRK